MSQICPQTTISATNLPNNNFSKCSSSSIFTKIFIYVDSREEPFSIRLQQLATDIKLKDFLKSLPSSYCQQGKYKYFFKSHDQLLGIIREEISDLDQVLPSCHGRITAWLLPAVAVNETQNQSSTVEQRHPTRRRYQPPQDDSLFTSGDEFDSSQSETTATTQDEDDDRFSSMTESTDTTASPSLRYYRRQNQRRRRREQAQRRHRASTYSTISLDVITVVLNLENISFLGISIVGQIDGSTDGGIYVGSIMKGGAVAADGRIEPGDMILQMNDISFQNMSNDEAVKILRQSVQNAKTLKLVVAKCWNENPRDYFHLPHPQSDPIHRIDPLQWLTQTQQALVQQNNNNNNNKRRSASPQIPSTSTIMSSTISSPAHHGQKEKFIYDLNLTRTSDMETIVKAMKKHNSGLDIRDRLWLKIIIPKSIVVEWLFKYVDGFIDKNDAKDYACLMLERGYIRHIVNQTKFSKSCYYIFGDLCQDMTQLTMSDNYESLCELDTDDDVKQSTTIYGYLDKHNLPLYSSNSSLTGKYKAKAHQSNDNSRGKPSTTTTSSSLSYARYQPQSSLASSFLGTTTFSSIRNNSLLTSPASTAQPSNASSKSIITI
ncbi:unnamed protein product [Didymodactylos carnosus]|uniref:Dishevelled n=1 Tax=Didymodactylos carnosus TaxID=1234261 RepID=A0A814CBW8_9BILA|nr:unnamed protein product [Didymodactylos carnosus]CAF3714855.1 unnamed protein product [Didymodactylos carnosus]